MQISQNNESITITTDDSELFMYLSTKIRDNFTASIGSRNKIIAFYNENEQIQRKYFFKLLSKIYFKSGSKDGEIDFLDNIDKKIKLIFQKPNSLQIMLNIGVKFDKNSVIFDLKNSEDLFDKYLVKSLSGVRLEKFSTFVAFYFDSVSELELLENILNYRDHLKYIVNFGFSDDDYTEFKKRICVIDSPKFHKRFSLLAGLLEEHFETLGCSADDDFEKVRSSYLELSKIYHPDARKDNGCTEQFQKIVVAYEALKPYYKEQDEFIKAC